ncbi:MAG: sensor histidine kinase [Jatrophihabitantaceae bacterium]
MRIRLRLALLFTAASLVLLIVGGVLFIERLRSGLENSLDVSLRSHADTLISQLGNFQDNGQTRLAPSLGTYAQVLTVGGAVLESSDGLPPTPLLTRAQAAAAAKGSVVTDTTVTLNAAGENGPAEMRLFAGPTDQVGVLIVVITSRDMVDAAVARSTWQLALLGTIALLLAGPGSWLLTRAALRPVERMRVQAAGLQEHDASSGVAVPRTRDEIARLAETLNGLLSRLHAAVTREQAFVADAGHELRTPLAVLQGELELARRPGRSRAELAATIDVAAAETDRLVRLAEDLLVLAHDTETAPSRTREFDLAELAHIAIQAAATSAAANQVLVTSCGPAALPVIGDPDRIRQAIDNVLTNAVRHSPPGATVTLTHQKDGVCATLTVTDQGTGFAPEFIPVAFERFSRSDHARHRPAAGAAEGPGGNGLGLAIVRAVMEAHHGTAVAENLPAGGARVTIRWPARPPRTPAAALITDTSP